MLEVMVAGETVLMKVGLELARVGLKWCGRR